MREVHQRGQRELYVALHKGSQDQIKEYDLGDLIIDVFQPILLISAKLPFVFVLEVSDSRHENDGKDD